MESFIYDKLFFPYTMLKKLSLAVLAATLMFGCSRKQEVIEYSEPKDTVKIEHKDWQEMDNVKLDKKKLRGMSLLELELTKDYVDHDVALMRWEYGDTSKEVIDELYETDTAKGIPLHNLFLKRKDRYKRLRKLQATLESNIYKKRIEEWRMQVGQLYTIKTEQYHKIRDIEKLWIMDKLESKLPGGFHELIAVRFYTGNQDSVEVQYKAKDSLAAYTNITLDQKDREALYQKVLRANPKNLEEKIKRKKNPRNVHGTITFSYIDLQKMKELAKEDYGALNFFKTFERLGDLDSSNAITAQPMMNTDSKHAIRKDGGLAYTTDIFTKEKKGRRAYEITESTYEYFRDYYNELKARGEHEKNPFKKR